MHLSVDEQEVLDTFLAAHGLAAEQWSLVRQLAEQPPPVWAFLFTCARLWRLDTFFDIADPRAAEDHRTYAKRLYYLLRANILDGFQRAEMIEQEHEAARILPEHYAPVIERQWDRDEFYRFLFEIEIRLRKSGFGHLITVIESGLQTDVK